MEIKELLGDAYKDGMTLEEVTEALKGVNIPKDQSAEIASLKDTISKKNTEAADWRRKYEATLGEAEKQKLAAEEQAKKDQEELQNLRKITAIAGYKASYLAMGYSEELAADTANAMYEGNNERLFENQRKHMEAVEKKAREDALRGSGRPGGSGNDSGNGESEAVKLAKSLGQERANIDKQVKAGMEQFFGRWN